MERQVPPKPGPAVAASQHVW